MNAKQLKFNFARRLAKLQSKLGKWGCDGILLGALEGFDANTYYYSGDEMFPTLLLVTPKTTIIYSLDPHSHKNTFDQSLGFGGAMVKIKDLLKSHKIKRLGADDTSTSVGALLRLQAKAGVKLIPLGEK